MNGGDSTPLQPIRVVNIEHAFEAVDRLWTPHVIGELNGQHVRIARVQGVFDWHQHAHEDELFLVISGRLTIELKPPHEMVQLDPGELVVIPRGVEHRPIAEEECRILLFEPAQTINTGNVRNERTVDPRIAPLPPTTSHPQ